MVLGKKSIELPREGTPYLVGTGTYFKCPQCERVFTQHRDTCPKCGCLTPLVQTGVRKMAQSFTKTGWWADSFVGNNWERSWSELDDGTILDREEHCVQSTM
jgi:hypothetical protein